MLNIFLKLQSLDFEQTLKYSTPCTELSSEKMRHPLHHLFIGEHQKVEEYADELSMKISFCYVSKEG